EAATALAANRSRTLLTGLGVTVGTMALALILSLALGLDALVEGVFTSEEQLRHVMVMPGFGTTGRGGTAPDARGEMGEETRPRLKRALLKRGYGGPPFQVALRTLDAATERELAALPGVESARAFVQDRYGVEFVDLGPASSGGPPAPPGTHPRDA